MPSAKAMKGHPSFNGNLDAWSREPLPEIDKNTDQRGKMDMLLWIAAVLILAGGFYMLDTLFLF